MLDSFRCRSILLLSCALSLQSWAAPITETPTPPSPSPGTTAGSDVPSVRINTSTSDSRTIDLLVEMQQPGAGVQFNERSSRSVAAEQRARAALAAPGLTRAAAQPAPLEAPLTPPSGLFGSGATPAVQARPTGAHDTAARGGFPSRTAGLGSADVSPALASWLQWPRDAMAYVRDNRAFVIGCAAVLLLLAWSGSWMFSRRRD